MGRGSGEGGSLYPDSIREDPLKNLSAIFEISSKTVLGSPPHKGEILFI